MKRSKISMRSVKEAVDNLPSGVCYFDNHDILRLCNRQMYRLGYMMASREVQSREGIDAFLSNPPKKSGIRRDGDIYLFPDGSAWKIQKKQILYSTGKNWTEYLAFPVTELYQRKQQLEKSNEEQRELMKRLEQIARNIVAITREEEILAMKMRIHNELGTTLQSTRQFFVQGCPLETKDKYVKEQRNMAKVLLGEVGNDDEIDVYQELNRIADRLEMQVLTEGELPPDPQMRNLLAMAVRECLTNTIRHANGDKVYASIQTNPDSVTIHLTNNGNPPESVITEGGGLSSLRSQIERAGGQMEITSQPNFKLTLFLPRKENIQ